MNEDQPSGEKDFRSILSALLQLGEQRDKLISVIDETLDRIKQNRKPSCTLKQEAESPTKKDVESFVPTARYRLQEMDQANERLQLIINRLNELV